MSFDREQTRPGGTTQQTSSDDQQAIGKQTLVGQTYDDPQSDDPIDLGQLATVTVTAEPEPIETEPAQIATEIQSRPLQPLPRLDLGATNDNDVQRDGDGNATVDGDTDDAPVLELGELATVTVTAEPERIEAMSSQPSTEIAARPLEPMPQSPTAPADEQRATPSSEQSSTDEQPREQTAPRDDEPKTTEDLRVDHIPEGRLPTNRAGQRYKPTISGDKIGKLRITSAFGETGSPHSVKKPGWQIGEDGKLVRTPEGKRNLGIDYVPVGTKQILAWFPGTVAQVIRGQKDGTQGGTGYGNRAIVRTDLFYKHDGEYRQVWCHYAHCESVAVNDQDRVVAGTVIGIVGNTGGSHGAHVDFRTWIMAGGKKIEISPNLLTTRKSGAKPKPATEASKPTTETPASKPRPTDTPVVKPPRGKPGSLKLGVNEVYREALLVAQQRTGIDAAALAALIDAEAAKDKGRWLANSRAEGSTAVGLTQFIDGTWIMMAKNPRTLLSERALAAGYVQRSAKGALTVVNQGALLALRNDPLLSIVSAAEYGTINLAAMKKDGVVPDGVSDDERAHYMYIGHHEGSAGAVIHYTDSSSCSEEQAKTALDNFRSGRMGQLATALRKQYPTAREAYRVFADRFSRGKFPAQVGKKSGPAIIARYLAANGGSWEHAYRAWLRDYANKKIQPDRFRA